MDEDVDVDTSLTDLHHGLDSSLDESKNIYEQDRREVDSEYAAESVATESREDMAEDQINMLQDMVLEMKDGFQTALQELSKIQGKDEGEANHSKKLQKQQQQQLDDLTETIHEIKNQLSSLTKSVKQIKDHQKIMKDHLEEVRSNRGSSQDSKAHSDRDRLDLPDDTSTPLEEWNTKLSKLPTEADLHNMANNGALDGDDDDVVAIACKSLTLTQALSEKCLKVNLYQSSDEDEEQETRRIPHYASRAARLVSDHTGNRRHSMPASSMPPNRNNDTDSATLRQKAVKDLADSERDYCSQLWSLLHTYLTPLQTAGFLSARELGVVFPSCLDHLYAEHCLICTGLQDKLVHWTYMGTVADLLARITDSQNSDSFLLWYKEYAEDLYSAVTCLRRILAQSSEFRSFLKAIKHSSCQREDLMSLLLAPVQHIPKYLLHLQQVAQYTPPTHPDFALLQTSLHRLRRFMDQLNEEVSDTIHALNQDSGQKLSTRDSGVHSNSTEDDTVISGKDFSKVQRGVSPDWLEDPYSHHHQSEDVLRRRRMRVSAGRLSTLSQPDLTIYKNLSSMNSDPQIFGRIPRSHSTLPTGGMDSSDDAETGRHYRKFKVKRRTYSPVSHSTATQDNLHYNISHVRPSSATDFLSHSHHQQQYRHHGHYRDIPMQPRNYQYQESQTRPHSAFGPRPGDSSHKPIIISRKHLRRSEPPKPASSNLWTKSAASSTMAFRAGYQRVPLSTRDMLPNRPSPYSTSDMVDGDDEEDDDTRVNDAYLRCTDGSHLLSIGHGSINNEEVDFYQGHVGGYGSQNLMSAAHPVQFSSAEVAASLARKLYNVQQEVATNDENLVTRCEGESSPEQKPLPALEKQLPGMSKNFNSRSNFNAGIIEQQMISAKDSNHLNSSGRSEQEESEERESVNNHPFVIGNSFNSDVSATSCSVGEQNDCQEKNGSLSSGSNSIKTISKSAVTVEKMAGGKTKQVSESNRQFLMSLSARTANVGREDAKSAFPLNSSEIRSGNLASFLNAKNNPRSSCDGSESADQKSETAGALAYNDLQNSLTSESGMNQAVFLSGNLDVQNTGPAQTHSRHSQQLTSSYKSKYGDKISPQKYQPVRSHIPLPSNFSYPRSFSSSSDVMPDLNRETSLSLDSHHVHSKPSLVLTSSMSNGDNRIVQSAEKTLGITQSTGIDEQAENNYQEHREVPVPDVADFECDGDKGARRGEWRKKMKDGGKFTSTDGLPKASNDPVSARKKMHFKSSIKSLFTKKKGRVILADVEREVVKEMKTSATVGVADTAMGCKDFRRSGNSKSEKFRNPQLAVSCAQHRPNKEIKCESCIDLNAFSSGPVKDSKKFLFGIRQDKSKGDSAKQDKMQSNSVKENEIKRIIDSKECAFSETELCTQQNILERLKRHNKRYGVIIEGNDAQFSSKLDVVPAHYSTSKWDNGNQRHFISCQNKADLIHIYQQRQHGKSSSSTEKSESSACNKSTSNFDKRLLDKQFKSQAAQNGVSDVRNQNSIEIDLLKSAPDVCNQNKNKTQFKSGKEVTQIMNISQNTVLTEKSGQQEREPHLKKLPSNVHDLCPQCQKCEMRQKEKTSCGSEIAMFDQRSNHSTIKNCDPEKNFCTSHQYSNSAILNGKSHISDCAHVSTNCHHSDPGEERKSHDMKKVMKFPLASDPNSVSSSRTLQMCADVKQLPSCGKNSKISKSYLLSNQAPGHHQEPGGSRPEFCISASAVDWVSLPEENHHRSLNTHNLPDVTKFSTSMTKSEGEKALADMSSQDTCSKTSSDHVLAADFHIGKNKMFLDALKTCSSSSHLNTPVLGECDSKVSDSATQHYLSSSLQKMNMSASPDHHSKDLPQVVTPLKSDIKEEQSGLSLSSRTNDTVMPKTLPSKNCSESFVVEETESEIIVKRFSLEDKEFFEHRYRLYYDEEGNSCKKMKIPENPKSLKALSASSVIAENLKQLPRGATPVYDSNHKNSDKIASDLTISPPSDDLTEQKQNGLNNGSHQESKQTEVSDPSFTQKSNTGPNGVEALLNECAPHFSKHRPCSGDLMMTSQENTSHDNDTQVGCGSISDPDASVDKSSKGLLLSLHAGSKETESTMKLTVGSISFNKETSTLVSDFSEDHSRVHAKQSFTNAVSSDESSSYKPKNPQPILLLSNVPEHQSPRQTRNENLSSENHARFFVNGSNTTHSPVSENIICSENIPSFLASSRSGHEPNVHVTCKNKHKANIDIQRPESFPSLSPGNDSFQHGFLRTSSPNDLFSIRPYMDYTASRANSDSGSLAPSDSARNSTSKSNSKGMSSEKLDKSRVHNGNRKTKNGSEKESKSCKNLDKCVESACCSDDKEPGHSGKGRHADGVRLRVQEQSYKLQYPRYSADYNPLISNAFLQKMAHLPQNTPRPASHLHDDESHILPSRRSMALGELHRKAHILYESEPKSRSYSSRNTRTPSCMIKNSHQSHNTSPNTSKPEEPQINSDDHSNGSSPDHATFTNYQASPDLLLSNDGSRAEAASKERSPLSKKAQQFFSKFTQAPISFFYRDSKSSGVPK